MLEVLYKNSSQGKRERNEDAVLVKSFANGDKLLAVADGIGGGVMGDIVSQKAIELLDNAFAQALEYPLDRLKSIVLEINTHLHALLKSKKGGTTLSVVYYKAASKRAFFVNIGDSRVWICRAQETIFATKDQNRYEQKLLEETQPKEDDKRLLYRALGVSTDIELEQTLNNKEWLAFGYKDLQSQDTLLLSSDGFHDFAPCGVCAKIELSFSTLLKEVEQQSKDNITVIVAKERE